MSDYGVRMIRVDDTHTRLECTVCQWEALVPHEDASTDALAHLHSPEPEPSVFGAVVGGLAILLGLSAFALMLWWLIPG